MNSSTLFLSLSTHPTLPVLFSLLRFNPGTSAEVQRLRLCLPMPRVWVWFLVGHLRSHMPSGQNTKTWNRSSIVTNSIKTFKIICTKKKKQKTQSSLELASSFQPLSLLPIRRCINCPCFCFCWEFPSLLLYPEVSQTFQLCYCYPICLFPLHSQTFGESKSGLSWSPLFSCSKLLFEFHLHYWNCFPHGRHQTLVTEANNYFCILFLLVCEAALLYLLRSLLL